jgi:osmotically-inducible protein OsmY
MIDATDVEVTSLNGTVTLRGRVDSPYMKLMTEVVAWSVSGVKEVQNEVSVLPKSQGEQAA